ncbi:unnamed protein product [Rhizoctonia solani]|uniref:Uncharacterized protein n=1 Tax=Rhizoctonia solani TaxID=456999 RepID=A0A8H3C7P2_9AGAM|nr:unnamed protein product [Rhizoctonia solani]
MARAPGLVDLAFNTLFLTKQKYLSWLFGDVESIELDSAWEKGNKLFDWYSDLTSHIIDKIQLRKEREPPMFHEYVAFSLRGSSRCFRIDRHSYGKSTLLVASPDVEIKARDTISQISSLEDRRPHPSDCLIEIKFNENVDLMLLLKICRVVGRYHLSRLNTFQRYSSSCHAQTILLFLANEYTIETITGRRGPLDNTNRNLLAAQPSSTIPTDSSDTFHQCYPSIRFITHEDQCTTCWKLALFRRVVNWGNEIDSVENVSGLFWDGVVRVAQHFIELLGTNEDSRSGLWFVCPRVRWMEVCQELTYQAIRPTWDTRLGLFERNLLSSAQISPESGCPHQNIQRSSPICRHETGRLSVPIKETPSGLKTDYPEMAKFLSTRIDNVRETLKQRVYDVCQRSGAFHTALNTYYEAINSRMVIYFGFKFHHTSKQSLISRIARIPGQPDHLRIPPDFLSQSQVRYSSSMREHDMKALQEYLVLLLYARGVRLEQYRPVFGGDVMQYVQDITEVREEIWGAILKEIQIESL